jgi:hypothetical protein
LAYISFSLLYFLRLILSIPSHPAHALPLVTAGSEVENARMANRENREERGVGRAGTGDPEGVTLATQRAGIAPTLTFLAGKPPTWWVGLLRQGV